MKRLLGCVVVALPALMAACGQSAASRTPDAGGIPLIPGARVVFSVRSCDRGSNPYCAIQMVVTDPGIGNSSQLLESESGRLHALGWSDTNADTGDEHAAESPGHKLRLTYATAALDLKDIDLGWVMRQKTIALTLSRTMFERSSSLSLMLETGSA